MKITISSFSTGDLLSHIADQSRLAIEQDCQRHSIALPPQMGSGEVVSYLINDSFEALLFNVNLKNDWKITFQGAAKPPVSFFTLAEGSFQQTIANQNNLQLKPLQSAICSPSNSGNTSWSFPKNQDINFLAIYVHKETFFQDIDCNSLDMPADLVDILYDIEGQRNFVFDEIFHLPIVTALQKISLQDDVGLLNSTFATAKLYEIMFLQLQQYQIFQLNGTTKILRADRGMQLIRNAEQVLTTRLQDPPTIPQLAKMVGLNQQALKKGFKQLYGKTINQYLNAKRLAQAELLIKSGGLKLQDVAMEVGYSDPSYFSRRFKEKYGIPPGYYAKQIA